jgi:putative transposon-encoded protein
MEIYTYIYGYTLTMTDREINIKDQILTIRENVETVYEKTVTPFGNSGKVDVAKKYIGKRVYVIVLKE